MSDRLRAVLVSGGNGFVGRNLVERLREEGFDVEAPGREQLDLRDEGAVTDFLREHDVGTVVHAAGKVGGIAANAADPVGFFVENVLVGIGVVRAAHRAGVTRLVNLSSSCVYPKDRERLGEGDVLTGPLEPTNEGYALAKLGVGRLCEWIADTELDRWYRTLLPCNLYGPHDHFEGERAHLVAAVLAKMHRARVTGAPSVEIWGDGTARREFMHVRDLCEAVVHVLPRLKAVPPRLNVGPGVDHSVREYYETAARVVGWDGELVHDLSRPVGMRRKLLDITQASELGWTARISLEAGMRDTYRWLLEGTALAEAA